MDGRSSSTKVLWNIRFVFCLLLFTTCQGMMSEREPSVRSGGNLGALQRDMKMIGDITICTGLKRYIACLEGSNLAITKAFWGRISDKVCPSDDGDPVTDCDGSDDTLPLVKGYCEGKRECSLEARHTILQKNGTHHCPGVNKYLVVNYTCIPESKSLTLCDSAEATLMCEAGWNIEVADVFWGRRSHAKYCGAEDGMECDSSESAVKYIRGICDGKKKCLVKADQQTLDNQHSPCTGVLKYLMINYVCKTPDRAPSGRGFMGVLQNQLTEMRPETSRQFPLNLVRNPQVQQDPKASQREAEEERKAALQRNINYNTKTNKGRIRGLVDRIDPRMPSNEEEDLTNALRGSSIADTIDTSVKKQNVPANNGDREKVDTSKQQKKNETSSSGSEAKEEKAPSDVKVTPKDSVTKQKEEKIKAILTAPATLRSILVRAKEVLKTLDKNAAISKSDTIVRKREGIARKKYIIDNSNLVSATEEASATLAEIEKNLSDRTALIRGVPGNKTLIPSRLAVVGIGNTP